jgi:hypothetical protein
MEAEAAEIALSVDAGRLGIPTGAVVRVRYTATEEQARRIDQRALRQALLDAGAHRVFIQPTIVRAERARVEGLDETIDEVEAFRLWLQQASINDLDDVIDALHERHRGYLETIA